MTASLFERVLVPIASRDDAVATASALTAADQPVGEIHCVHVIEKAGGAIDKASVEQREETAEEFFAAFRAELDHPVETEISYGIDVAEAIFAAAADIDATAIVITPRGGSRWVRLLTGDVALKLVTNTDRPVVVLPDIGDKLDGGEDTSHDAETDSEGTHDE